MVYHFWNILLAGLFVLLSFEAEGVAKEGEKLFFEEHWYSDALSYAYTRNDQIVSLRSCF